MEQLQSALERYKQQSSGRPSSPSGGKATVRSVPPPIVYIRTRTIELAEQVLQQQRILAGFEQGPFVESYKMLRTQVMHRLRENGWNVLGVTSPNEREGKTLTAINLAISLAMEASQTVLLVDADLRSPSVHLVFGLEDCAGIADYLHDEVPVEDLLLHPGIGRFVFMPGGRPIPRSAEALTSPKMVALMEELKHRYPSRVVLIDLPPLLTSSDALAFAPHTDALLLVVEEGRTTVDEVEEALRLVKGAAPVLGTVLNKAGRSGLNATAMKRLLSRQVIPRFMTRL